MLKMDKEFITGGQGRNVGSLNLVPSDKISAKPTGQGFGAARKGPQVHGGPIEAVTDEDYSKGESFKTNLNEVSNIGVK